MSDEAEVLFSRDGVAGIITLNRPKALNALTLNMVRAIHPQLKAWAADDAVELVIVEAVGEKAFCAGGDIRALHDWGKAGDRNVIDFYREEYRLNVFIKNYPKPYVALMGGIDMAAVLAFRSMVRTEWRASGLRLPCPRQALACFLMSAVHIFCRVVPARSACTLGSPAKG